MGDIPAHLQTPESRVRLFVQVGYPHQEILDYLTTEGFCEKHARDLIARVSERHVSAQA